MQNLKGKGQKVVPKMNIGLVASSAAVITARSTLSFNHLRLAQLRSQPNANNISSVCFFLGENDGNCASLSFKRQTVSTGGKVKLRALLGDGAPAVLHDSGATVLVVSGAYALVSTFDYLTQRNLIQQVIY